MVEDQVKENGVWDLSKGDRGQNYPKTYPNTISNTCLFFHQHATRTVWAESDPSRSHHGHIAVIRGPRVSHATDTATADETGPFLQQAKHSYSSSIARKDVRLLIFALILL